MKVFFPIYGHGNHIGHVTWTININFFPPLQRRLQMKVGVDWPNGSEEKDI